ncbi:DUF11 domain-containing protein [Pedobacter sp. HMF7647]|uniref:DUF11 domain-containing protein n=1 Tax=Hufsiella arboris TaxID=2695275 RepID=A0A7K1YGQ6_9SPHI|nr:gliding motility-associated C-terminal domain-containing protein [Hufsiella arboris]MXV53239.1 DUF11 domain-containing protein [Hufsiella arboris]
MVKKLLFYSFFFLTCFFAKAQTALDLSFSKTDISCNGAADGTATANPSGGAIPYQYTWSNGATTKTISNLAAGIYSCKVTDRLGASVSKSVVIVQPGILNASISQTNITCNGADDGTAALTVSGGSSPYTYDWSNGDKTNSVQNLAPGTYTCTITDANGCTTSAEVNIAQPSPLSQTVTKTDVLCNGASTGAATVVVTGGTKPYTFNWSNGATTDRITSVPAGDYTCTITDAKGCVTTASISILQPEAIAIVTSQTNVLCNGDNSGSATVTVTGGVKPYGYQWSNGASTPTINNLVAGTYTCIVNNANGCEQTATVTVTEVSAFTISDVKSDVKCNGGNDGSATLTVSGSTAPYTYSWFPSGGSSATASNLSAGVYTCTVTDANGCDTVIAVTIGQPSKLAFSSSTTDILCNGASTGAAALTVSGGTAPYSYSWSNGATTSSISNVKAGTYTCTITDANGCSVVATISIQEPPAIRFTTTQTNIICNGDATGAAGVIATGGAKPYSYLWNNGATTASISNVRAGTYTCTITDANNCQATATVTITQPGPITFTTNQMNVSCNGANSGQASVNVSGGGTGPYTYSWSPSGGTAAVATGLAAGTYVCTITDVNGCDTTATVTITQPTALTSTVSQTNILCNGKATGSAKVTAAGGVGPYKYNWLPYGGTAATASGLRAGTFICTITDANGCTTTSTVTITQLAAFSFTVTHTDAKCNGQATGSATVTVTAGGTAPYRYSWSPRGGAAATANGLSAGRYSCLITDANGCDTTANVIISEPAKLSATATKTVITCKGAKDGTATAVVSGGTAPYTYKWSPGGQTTAKIINLGPGTYTCTATDANGCTIIGTVSLVEPPVFSATTTRKNISCNGGADGSATAVPSGGVSPYTYSWSNGATTATINNLAAGTYTGTVKDANGCITNISATITDPAPISAQTSATNITCNGLNNGTATVNPSGGTPPYTYQWSNGGTTKTISNLAPGSYTVTVKDVNGCTFNVASPAVVSQPPALSVTTTQINVICSGSATGIAKVAVTGGTPPYNYQWSPAGGTGATATGLVAGTYTCAITDAKGCKTSATVTITDKSPLIVTPTTTNVSCKGAADGSISLAVSGGTAPYTYQWVPGGATTASINNLEPGSYTCTVTDANGCIKIQTIDITEPEKLKATITKTSDVTCNGASDGCATVEVTGGTLPYTYSWSPSGGTNATVCGLGPGSYTCTVTDANGCKVTTAPATINDQQPINGNISHTNVTEAGANNGSASVSPSGGTPPYTYSWSPGGQTTSSINNLPPGTYTCTITDANGCKETESVVVQQPTDPTLTISKTNVSCNGANDGSATVLVAGGTAPYTYSWSPGGQTTQTINNLAPGTYTCVVTDSKGLKDAISVTVYQPAPITAQVATNAVECNGNSTGSATLYPSGGSRPYKYLWSNGATTATASNLAAGTYNCVITDVNGCTQTISNIVITQPPPLSVNVAQINISCSGIKNGEASVTVSGGTAPYSYKWSPSGGNGRIATGLAAGTYTCLITDDNGCNSTVSVTITSPDPLVASATKANISCNGANDGTVTAVISGGTPPYSYKWEPNGETTATISNLSPGTYTCIVIDANGCKVVGTADITQPEILNAVAAVTNITCKGDADGKATANVTGGTAPYSYSWSTGSTAQAISNLTPGSYTCNITDANGCKTTMTADVTEPDFVSGAISKTDVSCNGGTDGSITISGTGGTAPYTYSWDNGATTAAINNLVAGNYVCTITDSHQCTGTVTVTITEPAVLSATTEQINVICNGDADGIANVTVTGGTAPYTYNWTPKGGTGPTATGLTAGTYTCAILDAKGCTTTATVTITQPDPLLVDVDQVNVSCKGAGDARVTLTPSGGTAPYTYSWSNGAATAELTNLAPGTQTYTVTDANGCENVGTIEITEPKTLAASSTHTNVLCKSGSDGSVTATAIEGTAPYRYSWAPGGATTATVTGLKAGTYTCTITDANGCTVTTSQTITEPTILAVSVAQTNISCNGAADGNATVTASGATPGYTYNWSNGATTNAVTGLAPGSYTCTIADQNGCDTTISMVITQPDVLAYTTGQTDVLCNGNSTGSATVTVSGGTTPYTYNWNNGATTATANNLAAGTYTCVITDAHGCTTTATVTISEPAVLAFTTAHTDADCNGNNTGKASVTASGGTSPYTYSWNTGATTSSITSLVAGTYTCTITDAAGCQVTATVVINEPTALALSPSQTNVDCNGNNNGSATISVTGGTPPYSYSWNTGETIPVINNLAPGTYTCTVTDDNGCTATSSVTITQPPVLAASVTAKTNVNCHGGNTGSATVSVTGGTAQYTYLWLPGSITTATASNLAAGIYVCRVTDANGCIAEIATIITQPSALTASTTSTNANCNGTATGGAGVHVSGGVTPYTYSWSNGATTDSIANLNAGTYTCTITDANNCTTTATVTITQPTTLAVTTSQRNVDCNGNSTGGARVTVSGGTNPYTYSWSNGSALDSAVNLAAGTYTCNITDANGCIATTTVTITEPAVLSASITAQANVNCNGAQTGSATVSPVGGTSPYTYQWSVGGITAATATGLGAGTYTCTVTDLNGCTTTATVVITQPDILVATIGLQTNVSCNGVNDGSVTVQASGGTAPYTYLWSNGATTAQANNIAAGNYTCTITDASGCTTTINATITEPAVLAFTSAQVNVSCNGSSTGSAKVTVSGGSSPYTYLWSNGSTTDSIVNVTAGTYTCVITDAHGCIATASITITEPTVLSFTTNQTNVTCNGASTGAASVTVSGGTSPYSYLWSNGATTAAIDDVKAGAYTCTITDANGCTTTASITITEAAALAAVTKQTNVDCHGNSTGGASVTVSGGTAPYTYSWSSGATADTISNLPAGSYSVTITDANGCKTSATVTITEPAVLSASVTSQANSGCDDNSGSATVTVVGGTSPYKYLWSVGGVTDSTITGLSAGSYTCTVTDAQGCTTTATAVITKPEALTALISLQTNVACNGGNDGVVAVQPSGGTPPYSYLWSNGETSGRINNLTAGTYNCTITDSRGCSTIVTATITEPTVLAFTQRQKNVACHGDNSGSAAVSVSGGTAPYVYKWSNGAVTDSVGGLIAGTYTCTITDSHGCDTTASVTITEPTAITFRTAERDALCNSTATGNAVVLVTGGTPPYTYRWSNRRTTETIDSLAAGTYTCTITDANGCDTTAVVVINQPDLLTAVVTQKSNVSCNGANDGTATVLPSGGTPPYTYEWSNGGTTGRISNLAPGLYLCKITGSNGCVTRAEVVITQPPVLTFTTSQTNVTCNGGGSGSARVVASGGTSPYTYQWSNGIASDSTANLHAGTYTCVITDANGCDTTATVTITEGAAISFTTSKTDVKCHGGSTGSAAVAVNNPGTYTYAWSSGATTAAITGLKAGVYNVTITNSNGCDTTASITIAEPATIAVTMSQTNISCNSGTTGSAAVAVSGGTAPYTYSWSNGQTTAAISGLTAGNYSCLVTDANGCDTTVSVTLLASSFEASKTVIDESQDNNADPNELLTYSIRVKNTGTTAIDTILISDQVPALTTFVSTAQGSVANNTLTINDRQLAVNEERVYSFVVRRNQNVGGAQFISNTASVSTGKSAGAACVLNPSVNIPIPTNTPTIKIVDLSILKQSEPKAVRVGDNYEYSITVSNTGATAVPVTVTDTLPSSISYLSSTVSAGKVNYETGSRILTWQIDSLPNGRSESLKIIVKAVTDGMVTNTSWVASPQIDQNPENNKSSNVKEITRFFIPNIITPNGDNKNDAFVIIGLDTYDDAIFSVYNRWGNQVYHNEHYKNEWTGEGLNEGTYFYTLILKSGDRVENYKGWIQLLR